VASSSLGKTADVDNTPAVAQALSALIDRWRTETSQISSSTERILHPAYQQIIGMGPEVVPLLLKELRDNGGHWFWALSCITRENPVSDEDEGNVPKMRDVWLDWGKNKGYL